MIKYIFNPDFFRGEIFLIQLFGTFFPQTFSDEIVLGQERKSQEKKHAVKVFQSLGLSFQEPIWRFRTLYPETFLLFLLLPLDQC